MTGVKIGTFGKMGATGTTEKIAEIGKFVTKICCENLMRKFDAEICWHCAQKNTRKSD